MTDVLFGLAAFFISIPWNFQYAIPNTKRTINVLNYIDTQYLGTQGVFAAILISGCAVWLYNKLMQRNFTIKLPDSVPPAVAQSARHVLVKQCQHYSYQFCKLQP